MTESITCANETSTPHDKDEMNERSLVDLLGLALFISACFTVFYSSFGLDAEGYHSIDFSLHRALAFACVAATYFVLVRLKDRDRLTRSPLVIAIAGVAQLAVPGLAASTLFFGFVPPFALALAIWIVWAVSVTLMLCGWINKEAELDEGAVSKVNWWLFIIMAVFSTVLMFLPPEVCVGAVAFCIVTSTALLYRGLSESRTSSAEGEHVPCTDDATEWTHPFYKRSGSYNMVVNGIILGFCSGLLITGAPLHGFDMALIGLASICSVVLFFVGRSLFPPLLYLEYNQRLILPLIVGGLAIISIIRGPAVEVISFLLFTPLFLVNVTNFFTVALRGTLLSMSTTYCFSLGRFYVVSGQAIGWLFITVFYLFPDENVRPWLCVVILILVSVHSTTRALENLHADADEPEPMPVQENTSAKPEQESDISKHQPFKTRCNAASQRYGLTQREAEILFYLAKGRNAKYIADQLFVAERTVKTHAYHIYQKMEIHSQQELINIVDEF